MKLIVRSPQPPAWVDKQLASCPTAGNGVNHWLYVTAMKLSPFYSKDQLVDLLQKHSTGCGREVPRTEVSRQVYCGLQATSSGLVRSAKVRPARYSAPRPSAVPISKIEFDPAALAKITARGPNPTNWAHYLYEKSPCRPEGGLWFLHKLFHRGENVLVFTEMTAKKPSLLVRIGEGLQELPAEIQDNPTGLGTWFLSNPVDGEWHTIEGGGKSCRSKEAITTFRYAVLESDQADQKHWLSFLVQLPAPIAAIYTSGGRSIHALLKVDAPSKEAWDEKIGPLKSCLKRIGADPNALTAVRLSRLPGCTRREKGSFQELLYLNPNPSEGTRIMDLPKEDTR